MDKMKKTKMKKKNRTNLLIFTLFMAFLGISWILNYSTGINIGKNFFTFSLDMIVILPPAFVLIGLFDVWVKRETIERNFGNMSGIKKYIWSILLAATTVGGTFVAFPVANALYHKGANYSSVFAYVTAASIVMIPMSIMEASILGLKFTLIRLGISLPLVVISASLLGNYFEKINYKLPETVE